MHKVYENDDLMMFIKRRYCRCCGNILHKRKTERIVKKGDPDHSVYCTIKSGYTPYGDIMVIGMEYYCENCKLSFSCDEQDKIINAQKRLNKKIVSSDEVSETWQDSIEKSTHTVAKMKWLLLLPVVGALLCSVFIFNGKLDIKTESNDFVKIAISSILLAIIVFVILKNLSILICDFSLFGIHNIKNIIVDILASLSFNIPTFIYIKHIEKK